MPKKIKELTEDIDIYYSREIDYKPDMKLKVYLLFLLFNAIFVGYVLFLGVTGIKQKIEMRKTYIATIQSMETNIEVLDKVEPFLLSSGAKNLREAIPDHDYLATYLVGILDRVYKNGFTLKSITFSPDASDTISIYLRIEGYETELEELFKDIESMLRLTNVKLVSYDRISLQQGDLRDIRLEMAIYKTPRRISSPPSISPESVGTETEPIVEEGEVN